jgi:hypothetical protein
MPAMASRKIFIFDIDSVLVEPRGYRAAVQATQAYFTRAMGLPDSILVDDDVYNQFEACRVTGEWDMVPIALAILLEKILETHPELAQVSDLESCIRAVRQIKPGSLPERMDYKTPIQAIGALLKPEDFPAHQVLKLAQLGIPGQASASSQNFLFFPTLAKTPLLEILLGHTRDIDRSPTTLLFQQFSLGSQVFTRTYDLPADVETPGFLLEYDQPLISKSISETLARLYHSGELALCAYTLRPSLPPREAQVKEIGYSPEAEMALQLVNLAGIPLIGYGRIHFFSQRTGWPPEKLLKPSPVQAIAAILAAINGNELDALHTALSIYQGKPADLASLGLVEGLSVHVFEDSAGGILAMQSAGDLLARSGMAIQVHPYGISAHSEKEAALQKLHILIFPTTEAAITQALAAESLQTSSH